MADKTVLITGGAGTLGRALADALRARGHCVVVGSRSVEAGSGFVPLDVADRAQVGAVIQSILPDLVIHLAATFSTDFDEALSINVEGARNLLDAIRTCGKPVRAVLAGSAAEYGVVMPDENPVSIDQVTRPISLYGLTKSWQSALGLMYARQGQDVLVARIFNLVGPGMSERLFIGRIDQQIREVLQGRRSRIEIGALSAQRDYVGLEEAADQMIAISERGSSGHVYHVASGIPIGMRDLLRQQLQTHGIDYGIVDEDAGFSNRPGYDVPVVYADMTQTRKLMTEVQNEFN